MRSNAYGANKTAFINDCNNDIYTRSRGKGTLSGTNALGLWITCGKAVA